MDWIYTRKSTEEQNQTSFEVQEQACRRWTSNQVTVLRETGSGADNTRPELNKMLSLLRSGDSVLIYDNSRLSRDLLDSLSILNTIVKKGARLICDGKVIDPSNPQDLLQFNMSSVFSDYQRNIQSYKSLEGMKQKRQNGDWIPSSLFGYDIIHGKHPKVTINESEAKWVRFAYTQFTNGKTYRQIALEVSRQLNKRIETSRITEWLRQPWYMGKCCLVTVRHPSERTKFYLKPRPEMEEQLIASNYVPAIVEEDIWWKAREVELSFREKGTRKEYWNRHRTHFLLTGLISCEECGCTAVHVSRTQHGKFRQGYELIRHQPYCTVDNKVIDGEILEPLTCISYLITLLSYENTAQFFAEESDKIQTEVSELQKRLSVTEDSLSQVKRKINRYMDLFEEGTLDREDFSDRIKKLKTEEAELKSQKQSIVNDIELKQADISEMLGDLTEDRIQDFIHFDTSKKNLMIHSICDSLTVSKTNLVISFKNGMSYHIKLNDKYKPWPKTVCVQVLFKNEPDFDFTFDTETHECKYIQNDSWEPVVNSYYSNIVKHVDIYLEQILQDKNKL